MPYGILCLLSPHEKHEFYLEVRNLTDICSDGCYCYCYRGSTDDWQSNETDWLLGDH